MNFTPGQVITEYGTDFEIQMWKITDILQTVTESTDYVEFDGSSSMWAFLISSKAGDLYTPVLAQKIIDEGFTDPICIYRNSRGGYGLGNGHHRLTCAILLGLDEIPVLYTDTDEYYPDASEGEDIMGRDEEVSDWLYSSYAKIYRTLLKEELAALQEENGYVN